jgi:copper chaperone
MEEAMGEREAQALLQVQGMDCIGCEQRLGKVLSRLAGVRRSTADHGSGRLVFYDPGLVDVRVLAERIEQAGYQVRGMEAAKS